MRWLWGGDCGFETLVELQLFLELSGVAALDLVWRIWRYPGNMGKAGLCLRGCSTIRIGASAACLSLLDGAAQRGSGLRHRGVTAAFDGEK